MRYFLGADGGGTKTEFVLTDGTGSVLAHCRLQGSNPNDCGMEAAVQTLKQGAERLCAGYPRQNISFFAGVAGAGDDGTARRMTDALQSMGFAWAGCNGDIQNILAAGLGEKAGAVAIMGTGCVAFGVNGGSSLGEQRKTYRVGGWGSLFDEGGSGWKIGRDVLLAVLAGFDGSGVPCPLLTQLVQRQLGDTVAHAIPRIYREGKDFVAAFAPLAFAAAQRGDAVAQTILENNIRQAARLLGVVLQQLPAQQEAVPVVVAGGLTHQWSCLQPLLLSALTEQAGGVRFALSALRVRPVWGALLQAGLGADNTPPTFFASGE